MNISEGPVIIQVRVTANAKTKEVVESAGVFRVRVTAPAVEGKANAAVCEALAAHFGVRGSDVRIIKGEKARYKTVLIDKRRRSEE